MRLLVGGALTYLDDPFSVYHVCDKICTTQDVRPEESLPTIVLREMMVFLHNHLSTFKNSSLIYNSSAAFSLTYFIII